ncbi:spore coat protein YutH [Bacillus pakistanensis]|uniref:Spore coat protein YutH n=1 Tax=Rossellomorea pakistanensis TaxID=992288 RepID=A0ABS2NED6_9BACI|nr:spore coat protein YutH [Bacillus pakistanensis]MBM7586213.1 spore coat protein YutH [Bacillus pakistanensis]
MEDILTKYYGLQPERMYQDGKAHRYMVNGLLYTIVTVTHMEQEKLVELYKISEHLKATGDRYVSTFVPSTEDKFLITEKQQDYVVVKNEFIQSKVQNHFGRKLAKFHSRGRSIEEKIEHQSRIGQWKGLWEKRIDQLETAFQQTVQNHPVDEFEKRFVESCPYFIGLAENAIQYLVDTELDDEPHQVDSGTVCHERFLQDTWGTDIWIRFPFDWIFDHGSRDIAEWVRERYLKRNQTYHKDIQTFLKDYQSITPLSTFSWRLIYARLLFPIHYFECIERYYVTSSEQQKLQLQDRLGRELKNASQYEKFLTDFYQIAEVPVKKHGIPVVGWLFS